MRVLIVTQKVDQDDFILGFFHDWLLMFSKFADVSVIANGVGTYQLPPNVEVYSLGKERGTNKIRKFFLYQKLFAQLLTKSDIVFFHMCPEYVLASHLLPKLYEKKTILWYVHKRIGWKLRIAHLFVDNIFTATKESCTLNSSKIIITGHGINLEQYKLREPSGAPLHLLAVGRVSAVKKYEKIIEIARALSQLHIPFTLQIIGPYAHNAYVESLQQTINAYHLEKSINFIGPVTHAKLPSYYAEAHVLLNFTQAGSFDKVILEAMASGIHVISDNPVLAEVLPEAYAAENPEGIAQRIVSLPRTRDARLRAFVEQHHNLETLIKKILS